MTRTQQEIELKLALPSSGRPLADVLDFLHLEDESKKHLKSIYFDAPDWRLRKAAIGLRVRSAGSKMIQTVKTGRRDQLGIFIREEYEKTISSEKPTETSVAETPVASYFKPGTLNDLLEPIFEVQYERTISNWVTDTKDAVEIAIDVGDVTTKGLASPIYELELELKSGAPKALFELANRIAEKIPVWPAHESKADKGFRLAGELLDSQSEPDPLRPVHKEAFVSNLLGKHSNASEALDFLHKNGAGQRIIPEWFTEESRLKKIGVPQTEKEMSQWAILLLEMQFKDESIR